MLESGGKGYNEIKKRAREGRTVMGVIQFVE